MIDLLINRLIGWLSTMLAGWLGSWLAGWLVGLHARWLAVHARRWLYHPKSYLVWLEVGAEEANFEPIEVTSSGGRS